ncbi:hypothetical protein OS493_017230 [Desmophyllum pertusum]|uniref:Uncharacterized protein n=1 Tax=Desmophyllum pertusum TaxID=174260 RepID=A0A9X0A139_9CNID|nr:hypothetical protein OS493_017230 [Desmophyllum pertusum]
MPQIESTKEGASKSMPKLNKAKGKREKKSICRKDSDLADPEFSDMDGELDDHDDDSSVVEGDKENFLVKTKLSRKLHGAVNPISSPLFLEEEILISQSNAPLTKVFKVPTKTAKRNIGAKEDAKRAVPKSRRSATHLQWTEEEKVAVFKYLAHWIRQGRVPGKRDCENCISKANGALDRREWTTVKYYIKNQIDKRKRVLTLRMAGI